MKNLMYPAFFAALSLSMATAAQDSEYTRDFSEADMDGDQQLSIEEAREALPDSVVIVDTNNDQMVNRNEAERAMPGLTFEGQSQNQNDVIGEQDYLVIIETIEAQGQGAGPGERLDQGQSQGQGLDDSTSGQDELGG